MNANTCPPGRPFPFPFPFPNPEPTFIGSRPNLVINGGMTVAQRGTSFTSVSSTQYTLDRWELEFSGSPGAVVTVTQSDDVPTGSGLSKSLKIDCTTAEAAVGAGEAVVLKTTLEAQDLQQLMYGNEATAQPATLSFWIKSPKAGVHCVALYMDDGNVHYIQEFQVVTADAWERQQLVFPGYPLSAIADDIGAGLTISFPLVAGTDFQAGKEMWDSGNDFATSDQQNLLDNTANNVCVAGVKLEVGDIATPFEHRSFADELLKCQRYARGIITAVNEPIGYGWALSTTRALIVMETPITMRDDPTISVTASQWQLTDQVNPSISTTTINLSDVGPTFIRSNADVSSGLTVQNNHELYDDGTGGRKFIIDADF